MKTDYISPAAAAISSLRRITTSARQLQPEQLPDLLRQNTDAE